MLNNKGMTLVEIVISIGLVSIVMVFTLNLLVELRSEEALGSNKTSDLLNRSIIMKTVQDDFLNKEILSISGGMMPTGTSYNGCSINPVFSTYTVNSCFEVNFVGGEKKYLVTASKPEVEDGKTVSYDYFIYGNPTTYEAWKLESGFYNKGTECYTFNSYGDVSGEAKYFRLYYPVKLSSANENTMMNFDLEFLLYYNDNSNFNLGNNNIQNQGCIVN